MYRQNSTYIYLLDKFCTELNSLSTQNTADLSSGVAVLMKKLVVIQNDLSKSSVYTIYYDGTLISK